MTEPWLEGAERVNGEPVARQGVITQTQDGASPWLDGAITVRQAGGARQETQSMSPDAASRLRAFHKKFDPNMPIGEYLLNEVKKAPGAILGFAPDVALWVTQKLGGDKTDFGNVTRAMQKAMGADLSIKPPGPGSETLGTLTTNIIGSAPFATGAITAGRGALGAATELVSGAGGGVGEVVGGLPGQVIGSAAGFRAGAMLEKGVPLARQAIGLVNGRAAVESTALKARGLVEGSPEFKAALAKQMEFAKQETIGDLRKSFAQEDVNALAKAFDEYASIQHTFPGFRSSVGEITGNEPALALQGKLESRNIPALEERGARVRGNQQTLADAQGRLVPQPTGNVRSVMRTAGQSIDDDLRALGGERSRLEGELTARTSDADAAAVPLSQVGADIKALSREGYAASKGRADQKYKAFRAAIGEDGPADAGGVLAKVKELQEKFVFDRQPEILGKVSGALGKQPGEASEFFDPATGARGTVTQDGPKQLSVNELDDLSSAANRDIQMVKASANPDRKAIAQLEAIRAEAQATIRNTLSERGNTDALAKYDEAQRYFRDEHAPKYLTGVNLKLRQQDALNEARVKPEAVVAAYYKPNGTTEAQRFNTQFADNGAAKESLARGVFDLYKKEVIDAGGGIIDPKKHDFFMRKYAAANAQYPWIAKRLEKNAVAGEIAERMAEKRAMIGEVASSNLARAIAARDPEAFLNTVTSDKRELFKAIGRLDQGGRKNLAIAVLNKAWDDGGKATMDEQSMKLLMRSAFGSKQADEHLANLAKLARAIEIISAAPKTSPMTAITEDSLKAKTGTSWTQVMSALRAIGRRPGSGDWFAMVFGGQALKARIDSQKNAILKEQLFDPDLLKSTLLSGSVPSAGKQAFEASARGRQLAAKVWDLTKAAVGEGAATAAAIRVPAAERE